MRQIEATFYRGGTSKALIFERSCLPKDSSEWAPLFLSAMGSPDSGLRQLDGMGGGQSSLSKVAVVNPSSDTNYDVEYLFVQVGVQKAEIDMKGNCGNIVSAIGPYAFKKGWGPKVKNGTVEMRILNLNTQKLIRSRFEVQDGEPVFSGDCRIDGVSGAGAPIELVFESPGGAATGFLFPSGSLVDRLTLQSGEQIAVSCVDASNATVFVAMESLGLTGDESLADLESRKELMGKLEEIRCRGSVLMGIAKSYEEAQTSLAIPYLGLISKGPETLKEPADFSMRVLASRQLHKALPLTVSLCAAVAAQIPGTLVAQVANKNFNSSDVLIAMPTGVMRLKAEVQQSAEGVYQALRGGFLRTARPLMEGRVFIP